MRHSKSGDDDEALLSAEHRLSRTASAGSALKFRGFVVFLAWVHILMALAVLFMVMPGFTWIDPNLPASSVPFYQNVTARALKPWRSARWNVMHIFFMMQIPVYILPAVFAFTFAANGSSALLHRLHFLMCVVAMVFIGAMFGWDVYKLIRCEEWIECLNHSPLVPLRRPSMYYWFEFFGRIAMFAATLAKLLVGRLFHKKMAEFVLMEKYY